jgi:hypothetical protein
MQANTTASTAAALTLTKDEPQLSGPAPEKRSPRQAERKRPVTLSLPSRRF